MPKRAPFAPSPDDRRDLSEHLLYEVQGVYYPAFVLATVGGQLDQSVINVHLDAFTIHVRQLIDFFWKERRPDSGTTAYAEDFFTPGRWAELCPEQPELLDEAVRRKIGWGVAHLTYDRGWADPSKKGWDAPGIVRALAPTVIRFVDEVDASQFTPDEFNSIRPTVEPWLQS